MESSEIALNSYIIEYNQKSVEGGSPVRKIEIFRQGEGGARNRVFFIDGNISFNPLSGEDKKSLEENLDNLMGMDPDEEKQYYYCLMENIVDMLITYDDRTEVDSVDDGHTEDDLPELIEYIPPDHEARREA